MTLTDITGITATAIADLLKSERAMVMKAMYEPIWNNLAGTVSTAKPADTYVLEKLKQEVKEADNATRAAVHRAHRAEAELAFCKDQNSKLMIRNSLLEARAKLELENMERSKPNAEALDLIRILMDTTESRSVHARCKAVIEKGAT